VLKAGIADAARAAHLGALAGEDLAPALQKIARAANAVEQMADAAGLASTRAGHAADVAASGVQQFGSETLPELRRLMADLSRLSMSLERLSDQTTQNPSSLLTGRPVTKPGPGEGKPP
jgi:phospholipid/cholesterol/gamma-HCH transport system substrate-binding protein